MVTVTTVTFISVCLLACGAGYLLGVNQQRMRFGIIILGLGLLILGFDSNNTLLLMMGIFIGIPLLLGGLLIDKIKVALVDEETKTKDNNKKN